MIKIHGICLHAHQFCVFAQSKYLRQAAIETETIELNDESAAAYWRVFQYMYRADYSDEIRHREFDDDPKPLSHVRAYAVADILGVEGAKVLAHSKFQAAMREFEIYNRSFSDCVREVYAGAPRDGCQMRAMVVDTLIRQVDVSSHSTCPKTQKLRLTCSNWSTSKSFFEIVGALPLTLFTHSMLSYVFQCIMQGYAPLIND
ncbi:hypothetical protein K3495_g9246 [Podosphaera aphanis]|nr:hypothetical protein K3495_g9246 [Podosphaera aphanis]